MDFAFHSVSILLTFLRCILLFFITCVLMCGCVHMDTGACIEEGVRSPGTGVKVVVSCHVDSGNLTGPPKEPPPAPVYF